MQVNILQPGIHLHKDRELPFLTPQFSAAVLPNSGMLLLLLSAFICCKSRLLAERALCLEKLGCTDATSHH